MGITFGALEGNFSVRMERLYVVSILFFINPRILSPISSTFITMYIDIHQKRMNGENLCRPLVPVRDLHMLSYLVRQEEGNSFFLVGFAFISRRSIPNGISVTCSRRRVLFVASE